MLVFRWLVKTALLPVMLLLLILKVLVKISIEISSVIFGVLILFVAGCIIYTIMKQVWIQTFLLVLIEAGIMGVVIATGGIEGLIDAVLMRRVGI